MLYYIFNIVNEKVYYTFIGGNESMNNHRIIERVNRCCYNTLTVTRLGLSGIHSFSYMSFWRHAVWTMGM